MVTWFFENNQFANAWIPFDRNNQKKLEYVYRHHDELINYMSQQQEEQLNQNKEEEKSDSDILSDSTTTSSNSPPLVTTETQHNINNIIKNIDLEEEDASIHEYLKYDHNCIFIHLVDSHFEQEITLYPAMLLGSLPDRDILIVRAEMMDQNKNKYLDV